MSETRVSTPHKQTFIESFRVYLKPIMLAMLVLGFASGLPLMMVFSKLSTWLREVGVDRTTIGGMYAVSLAYSLKMFWAPLVDKMKVPILGDILGQRRSWMVVAISGTVVGLITIATSNPEVSLTQTVIGALILAFSGATLDISVDAWRIESAPNDEQANMAAVYNLGYRFAIMFAGYGIAIAGLTSWLIAYGIMATAMLLIMVAVIFFISEPEHEVDETSDDLNFIQRFGKSVATPFRQIATRFGPWVLVVLAIVALYRISDFTMGVMASPFYIDLGYSTETIGLIQGTFGPWPIVVGGFLGGFVAVRYSLLPALLAGGIITILTNGAFALLALAAGPGLDAHANGDLSAIVNTPSSMALLGVIVADNLAAGFVGSVFIAYMSAMVDRKFAATQYAVLSSTYSIFCKMVASTTSGPLSEAIGWAGFFSVTALYTIVPMLLIIVVMMFGPKAAKGKLEEEPEEPVPETQPAS
jgi:PAT family beta-lactamase induction signal transducer AmpG